MGIVSLSSDKILKTLVDSGCFEQSTRQYELLKYLMTENDAGRGDRVKAYSIALDVLGRDKNFDNSADSIVRVEMHKLRKNLKLFNDGDSNFTVNIPKASYIPVVRKKPSRPNSSLLSELFLRKATYFLLPIIVLLFMVTIFFHTPIFTKKSQQCSDRRPNATVINKSKPGETDTGTDNLVVKQTISTVIQQYQTHNLIVDNSICQKTPHYLLEYTMQNQDGAYQMIISVKTADTSEQIFSKAFQIKRGPKSSTSMFSELVRTTSDLFKPDGLLPSHAVTQKWKNQIAKQNMLCWVATYDAGILDKKSDFETAKNCLEYVIKQKNPYPESYALLAYIYILEMPNLSPEGTLAQHKTIRSLLEQGDAYEPKSFEVVASELFYEMRRPAPNSQKIKQLNAYINNSMHLNYSAQLQRVIALGFGLGDWEEGLRARNFLRTITSDRGDSMLLFDVGYALLYEDPEIALEIARAQYSSNNILSNLLFHATANLAGDRESAMRTKKQLQKLGLTSKQDYIRNIEARNFEPKIKARVIEGLMISLE